MKNQEKLKNWKENNYIITESEEPHVFYLSKQDGTKLGSYDNEIINLYIKLIAFKYFTHEEVDFSMNDLMIEESLNQKVARITECNISISNKELEKKKLARIRSTIYK